MGMVEFEKALALVRLHPEDAHFVGPRSEHLVRVAEATLGVKFPPSYRRFALELGAGSIAGEEIYGVVEEEFVHSSVPNGMWLTLKLRQEIGLEQSMIVIYSTGAGEYFALDTSRTNADGECPVVVCEPASGERSHEEIIAVDFGVFLLDRVEEVLSDS